MTAPDLAAPGDSSPDLDSPAASPRRAVDDVAQIERLADARRRLDAEVHKRIVGQDEALELLLICLLAKGHGLFVGVPGLAKTLLIQTLAEVLSLKSSRIQFTPDLMPADITGTDVLEEDQATGARSFRFVPGPVFTNLLLADEINRTPPKTQAALLQAMAEGRVTAGGRTYPLDPPFLVLATQNPIEQEGTFPLPEAQLDRFLLQVDVGYPSADEEAEIVRRTTAPTGATPAPVLDHDEVLEIQALIPRIPVADHVITHAVSVVRASRPEDPSAPELVRRYLRFGAGPRASQALIVGAKARAALQGRFAAEREDVDALIGPVLRHRLVPSFRAEAEDVALQSIIDALAALD